MNIHSFSAETIIFLGFVSTAEGLLSSGLEGTVVEPLLSPDAGFVVSAAGVVFVGPLLTEGAAEMASVPLVAGSAVSGAAVTFSVETMYNNYDINGGCRSPLPLIWRR